jgi:hypothetical protein
LEDCQEIGELFRVFLALQNFSQAAKKKCLTVRRDGGNVNHMMMNINVQDECGESDERMKCLRFIRFSSSGSHSTYKGVFMSLFSAGTIKLHEGT